MSESAKEYGIKLVELHTNYGVELHSKYEKCYDFGIDVIKKMDFTNN